MEIYLVGSEDCRAAATACGEQFLLLPFNYDTLDGIFRDRSYKTVFVLSPHVQGDIDISAITLGSYFRRRVRGLHTFEDPEDVLEYMYKIIPDAVFAPFKTDGFNGIEFARKLRRVEEDFYC